MEGWRKMTDLDSQSMLVEVVNDQELAPPCDKTLQVRVTQANEGTARGIWEVEEKFINGIGVAMGGFVAAAADIMMAYALASKIEKNQKFSTIDLHTTFHRSVMPGNVEVEARVERLGRSIAYLTADLTQDGQKVASVVSNLLIR